MSEENKVEQTIEQAAEHVEHAVEKTESAVAKSFDQPSSSVTSTDKAEIDSAKLMWILTIFFGFIPCLIFFLTKKDKAYVLDQSKEALNWCITLIIANVVISIISSFVAIIGLLSLVLWIVHLAFTIMGVLGTKEGKSFRVPFALRLIK